MSFGSFSFNTSSNAKFYVLYLWMMKWWIYLYPYVQMGKLDLIHARSLEKK